MKNIGKLRKQLHEPVKFGNLSHITIIVTSLIFFLLPLYLLMSPYSANKNIKPAEAASKVALDLYPQHYQLFTNPQAWIQKLNDSYEAYYDLTGYIPHSGATIVIKEFPTSQMGGALMYAGNPIHWSDTYVPDMINKINNNDLSFGPIHELGHDFDVTPYSYYYIGSGDTPINAEQWANFKLTYVADTLVSKYPDSTFYQSRVGIVPIGPFSKRYFEDLFAQEWLASSKSDWKAMKADAYTGLLYSLARKYGWDIYKKTFRDYLTLKDPLPTDNLEKINLFVKFLSKNAGIDLKPTFINWGIPVKEYTPAPNPAPEGYVFCSYEWDTCKFSGTTMVAFGANGKFNYGTYTNSVGCFWNVFGDPLWGVTKACYYKSTAPTPTPTVTPVSFSETNVILTPTPVINPTTDSDGDGFPDVVEVFLGTNPKKACVTNFLTEIDSTKPSKPSKTWPADLYAASGSALPTFNRVNLQDITSFMAPIRRLNTKTGDADYDKRWDLNADGVINIIDITIVSTFKPPVLDGIRAFNGSSCPAGK